MGLLCKLISQEFLPSISQKEIEKVLGISLYLNNKRGIKIKIKKSLKNEFR
ncbi:MAG: hypothetical protein QXJ14_03830 [Candidatus Aenigmatarchaeota archaeon]